MAADKDLIKGINLMLAGKEEGFNILYSKTHNYVYGRAKMIMKDEEDALDLTQEVFVQAYKHIHTLQDANNIYAWLGGITYRHGMKIFRKKRDLLVNEEAEGIFEDIVSEDKDFRPEENAELKATSNIIMSMIEELPELQKAAILAFYYDNMKIDDIAELFECSSNTIKSRLNYAKKYLKDKVEAHEKAYAYKLHSVSPAVIILAFKSLFASEKYTATATVAQGIYNTACTTIGFAPAAIATAEATMTGGASAATTTTTAAGGTATASATTAAGVVAKAGMAIGTKITLGLAAVVTVGALGVGGMYVAENGGLEGIFESFENENGQGHEDIEDIKEIEVKKEGVFVDGLDAYYSLMAQYAQEGVTEFEIYLYNGEDCYFEEFLCRDSKRLQKESGVQVGIFADQASIQINEETQEYQVVYEWVDDKPYALIKGTLEYGNYYAVNSVEEYEQCLESAISNGETNFRIYLYIKTDYSQRINIENEVNRISSPFLDKYGVEGESISIAQHACVAENENLYIMYCVREYEIY